MVKPYTAWTVGNPNVYDRALARGPIKKQIGGWVWRSLEECVAWLDERGWHYKWPDSDSVPLHPYRLCMEAPWEESIHDELSSGAHILNRAVRIEGKEDIDGRAC